MVGAGPRTPSTCSLAACTGGPLLTGGAGPLPASLRPPSEVELARPLGRPLRDSLGRAIPPVCRAVVSAIRPLAGAGAGAGALGTWGAGVPVSRGAWPFADACSWSVPEKLSWRSRGIGRSPTSPCSQDPHEVEVAPLGSRAGGQTLRPPGPGPGAPCVLSRADGASPVVGSCSWQERPRRRPPPQQRWPGLAPASAPGEAP